MKKILLVIALCCSPATADGQYTLSWGGGSGTVGKRYRGIKYTEN